MQPKLIYLDTNLWNALCDQGVSPARMVELLAAKNARLALGHEAVYEMAKTFHDSGDEGRARGMLLFSYVHQYLSEQISVVRTNMDLIAGEMQALQPGSSVPDTLLNSDDYETTRVELEKLSRGEVSERVKEHIESRVASAEAIRSGQIAYLKKFPEVKQQLTDVPSDRFPQWLNIEMLCRTAQEYLAGEIAEYFPEATLQGALDWAQALLDSPVGRVSKAIVRRSLYYNWRCAHRESVSKDIYFDSNHVLNANYADVYATKEPKQSEYAGLLLTSATQIAIYDGTQGLEQWLTGLIADGG